jgi:DNA-binding IclR family transcriptional regulator
MKKPADSQSLSRGLKILEAYTAEKQSWGIRELGRKLEIDPATIYRLVATLATRGYLEKNLETQKYHLGPKVVRLAANYSMHNSLVEIAHRVFAKHARSFPYNFYLGIMRNNEVIYIALYESRGPLKITTEPGETVSLPSSAIGKILLASKSDEFIRKFLAQKPLKQLTPLTITRERELFRQIKQIRKLGYAINRGEIYPEIAAVAAPINGPDGAVIAGLSLGFPLHYLDTKKLYLDDVIAITQSAADEISLMNQRVLIR